MSNKKTILGLFQRFMDLKVLIIGDVMIDAYLWGNVSRISPEAPVPVVALKKRESRMGGAANVALNIQNMGAVPILCSVIGRDEKGKQFLDLLQENGMKKQAILESDQRKTTIKYRILGNKVQLLRVDEEQEKDLSPEETNALFESISEIVRNSRPNVIIFEDYDKGVITPELIHKTISLAHENDIPVAVDPKKRNFLYYKHSDLFKPNLKELLEGLKLDNEPTTPDAVLEAVGLLQDKLNSKMIMVTLSDKGIVYQVRTKNEEYSGHIPAHVRQIADVSGAGDTVISIAALCLAAGATPDLTVRLANIAGGLVCEQAGVVPVKPELLLQEALAILCK